MTVSSALIRKVPNVARYQPINVPSLVFVGGALVFPYGSPSNAKEFHSENGFLTEHDTFWDFLIRLLSVLNELNLSLMGEYYFFC